MKKSLLFPIILSLFLIPNAFGQNQKNIIINELSQGSGTNPGNNVDEWIELLVTADNTNIQGVYLDVDHGGGTLGNNITVQLSTSFTGFAHAHKGATIVIYNSALKDNTNLGPDDTDFSDGTLLIPSDNTTYLTTTGWQTSTASGDAIGLFNPKSGGTVEGIMAIAWGGYSTFPTSPFTNGWGYATVSSGLTTSQGLAYTGGTTSGVSTVGNWSIEDDASSTPGTTNGGSNDNLPVELTSFSASVTNGNTVNLTWNTATEVNNYGFNVERSSENESWQKIGFVAGAGNSNSPRSYSFNDNPSGASSFSYRLKQVDVNGNYKYYDPVTVNLSANSQPKLLQNNPNPFNPSTTIKFYIPNTSDVTIRIYDMLGREVTTLFNKQTTAGYHNVYWNGKNSRSENVSSGVYLYRLTAGSFSETKKMNLLK